MVSNEEEEEEQVVMVSNGRDGVETLRRFVIGMALVNCAGEVRRGWFLSYC